MISFRLIRGLRCVARLLSFVVVFSCLSLAQNYIDPNKGNVIYTKRGIMDGNNVRTIFLNHGEVAHWPDAPSGEWPKGTGHQYVDGVAVIVQAETRDSSGQIIHPLETNYREFIRKDPVTGVPLGMGTSSRLRQPGADPAGNEQQCRHVAVDVARSAPGVERPLERIFRPWNSERRS